MKFEKKGLPTITVVTEKFEPLAREQAKSQGFDNLALIVIPHPVGGVDPDAAVKKADDVVQQLVEALTVPGEESSKEPGEES